MYKGRRVKVLVGDMVRYLNPVNEHGTSPSCEGNPKIALLRVASLRKVGLSDSLCDNRC